MVSKCRQVDMPYESIHYHYHEGKIELLVYPESHLFDHPESESFIVVRCCSGLALLMFSQVIHFGFKSLRYSVKYAMLSSSRSIDIDKSLSESVKMLLYQSRNLVENMYKQKGYILFTKWISPL